MFKLLKTLLIIIWIVDILNMNIMIDGINVREFLDITVPVNGWAWFLFWLFVPGTEVVVRREDK